MPLLFNLSLIFHKKITDFARITSKFAKIFPNFAKISPNFAKISPKKNFPKE